MNNIPFFFFFLLLFKLFSPFFPIQLIVLMTLYDDTLNNELLLRVIYWFWWLCGKLNWYRRWRRFAMRHVSMWVVIKCMFNHQFQSPFFLNNKEMKKMVQEYRGQNLNIPCKSKILRICHKMKFFVIFRILSTISRTIFSCYGITITHGLEIFVHDFMGERFGFKNYTLL